MIATQYGSNIVTSTNGGVPIADFYISSESEMVGYCDEFILIRNGNHLYTVDQQGYQIGFTNLSESSARVQGVTASGFSVRTGSFVQVYDQDCRPVHSMSV
jgi:hypothetical protein